MYWNQMSQEAVAIGWDFYGPALLFLALIVLAVPNWAAITALGAGFITPPLGRNLFVVSGLTGESILRIPNRASPFVMFMLLVVLLITYVPVISTAMLPDSYK